MRRDLLANHLTVADVVAALNRYDALITANPQPNELARLESEKAQWQTAYDVMRERFFPPPPPELTAEEKRQISMRDFERREREKDEGPQYL